MYKFGKGSSNRLTTTHKDLQLIFNEAIKYSPIDFGVSEGHRLPSRQFELYKKGRNLDVDSDEFNIVDPSKVVTYLDGYNKKSKHNESPAMAVDFYAYVSNKPKLMWDKVHLSIVIGLLLSTANRLYEENKISYLLKSGADWNRNGEFLTDQSFDDMPHVELYKNK